MSKSFGDVIIMWKSNKDAEKDEKWILICILFLVGIIAFFFITILDLNIRLDEIEGLGINDYEEVCYDWITIEMEEYIIPDQIYDSSCANYINCIYNERHCYLLCNSFYIEGFYDFDDCRDLIPYVHYYDKTICNQTILVKKGDLYGK